jgi:preprotein translocase subunit SecA
MVPRTRVTNVVERSSEGSRRTDAPGAAATGGANGAGSPRKMGRNERCWCGSGKKYKFCHGR